MIRTAKPKLSVSIAAAQSTVSRPSLSLNLNLKSPAIASPRSPLPLSPAAATASSSKRFSTLQVPSTSQPSYSYVNSCSSKSILKKQAGATTSQKKSKSIQFNGNPTVHCITPIENGDEYYGSYRKLSREERRWIVRE
ncbi:hypothetical protein BJX68DRAFT_226627 [Aspergillus pseudodeflectus]|uniref:Uncharacterized protein n=2 Tax=Aspergillus subgen. Nidulantes TaxID=2720870 RepID=A0A0U5FX53_ASPCI|nr:hypothetical protein ASPCAL05357 [Aspergillus calidoustus]